MILLKTTKEKLLMPLRAISKIVERKHTKPILANVLIRKAGRMIELTTSDEEVQLRTQLDLDGDNISFATTVAAGKLIEILQSMPDDQIISLSAKENKLILQGGKSRFTLQTLSSEDFPIVNEAPDFGPLFSLPQKTLKKLINQVHFAMAVEDIRYYFKGILFVAEGHDLTLVATDGHRLALARGTVDCDIPRQQVILPRKTVLELQRLLRDSEKSPDKGTQLATEDQTIIKMQFAANQAKFSFSGIEFVSKLVEGKFPDYNRVIPKDYQNQFTLSRTLLLSSLQRVSILTSEKFKGIRMNIEPGLLSVASSNAEQEEAKEEIDIDYSGDPIEIGFNVPYLIDPLSHMGCDMITVSLKDTHSGALMTIPEDEGFSYVVMPMRI